MGGLRLKGATRASFGVGGRVRHKILELEGTALGGVIAGRRGYGAVVENGRTTLPQIGGQLKWVAYVWYGSLTRLWTRLPFDVIPADGSPTQRIRTSWSPMTTVQVGVRVGIGR